MRAPEQAEELARMRKAARRARAQGRRWYLRAVLMVVIAAVSLSRGGQIYVAIGVSLLVLAAMAASLGRSMRRQGAAMEEKMDLMQHASPERAAEPSG